MNFLCFSKKQLRVMNWWLDGRYEALICDGAVRSGKTTVMALSFALWAMERFDGKDFALCGRTIGAVRRNIVEPMKGLLGSLYAFKEKRGENCFFLSDGGRQNRFYLFGGRDENSAGLIQGMTLGGVLMDETVLMPRSFVEQALARCSEPDAKFWFNCNPQGPGHWFYQEWIKKAGEKGALRLHFTMADNPSLTPAVRARYEKLYSGIFYDRYIKGEWAAAEGLVYPMFDPAKHVLQALPPCSRYWISCDYGTLNPMSMGLWGEAAGKWVRLREYYHDGRVQGQKTDEEYYAALSALADGLPVKSVVVDPSAASFIQCIRRHGQFLVKPAKNAVLPGIRQVAGLLGEGKLLFSAECVNTLREFSEYVWEDGGLREQPKKEHDHAMDEIRYFAATIVYGSESFF